MLNRHAPDVIFKTRVRDESIGGDNPFRWQDLPSREVFAGKRIVLFSPSGRLHADLHHRAMSPRSSCITPRCATPAPTRSIACRSTTAFVMFQWGRHLGLKSIKLLPDGSGDFTRRMGMLINKDHLGFGLRSWRYAAVFRRWRSQRLVRGTGHQRRGRGRGPIWRERSGPGAGVAEGQPEVGRRHRVVGSGHLFGNAGILPALLETGTMPAFQRSPTFPLPKPSLSSIYPPRSFFSEADSARAVSRRAPLRSEAWQPSSHREGTPPGPVLRL